MVCDLSPPRLHKIHDQQSLTLLWHSVSEYGREPDSVRFDHQGGQHLKMKQWHTNVNSLRLTVASLNATINSETQNTKAEIGTDRSSHTCQDLRVDRYASGFGQPSVSWSCSWTGLELNWPVFAVQTRTTDRLPGPVANTRLGESFASTRGGCPQSAWAHCDDPSWMCGLTCL